MRQIYFAMVQIIVSFANVMYMMLRCRFARTGGCCTRLKVAGAQCDVPYELTAVFDYLIVRRLRLCILCEAIHCRSLLTGRVSSPQPSYVLCAYRCVDICTSVLIRHPVRRDLGGHRCCRCSLIGTEFI